MARMYEHVPPLRRLRLCCFLLIFSCPRLERLQQTLLSVSTDSNSRLKSSKTTLYDGECFTQSISLPILLSIRERRNCLTRCGWSRKFLKPAVSFAAKSFTKVVCPRLRSAATDSTENSCETGRVVVCTTGVPPDLEEGEVVTIILSAGFE